MNLAQAYQGWQQQSQNRDLYVKTREAFRKAWFTLPTNKPCSYYTKEVLGEALAETRVIESSKAKAASVMIHVLTFANFAEPKFNPKPDFTFNDLMEYTKGPLADPEKVKPKEKPSCLDDDDHDLDYDPAPESGQQSEELTKPEEIMKPKKPRGKQPKPVVQIDPNTMQVIKEWRSMSEAQNELNVCHVDVAVAKMRKAGGFYWSLAEDADTFKDRLDEKLRQAEDRQKQHAASMREKKASAQPKQKKLNNPTHFVQSKEEINQMLHKPDGESSTESTQGTVPAVTSVSPVGEHATSHQGQSPCAPANAASKALAVFTDDELLAELDRRGWQGELRRMMVVAIGV